MSTIKDELISILESRYGKGLNFEKNIRKYLCTLSSVKNPNIIKFRKKLINTYSELLNNSCSLSKSIYCAMNDIVKIPKCVMCNADLKYYNYTQGYSKFCSKQCFDLYLNAIKENVEIEDKKLYIHNVNLKFQDYMNIQFGENYTNKNIISIISASNSNFKDLKLIKFAKLIFKCRNTLFNSNMGISETLYLIINESVEIPKCAMCNNLCTFLGFCKGYTYHCSNKCIGLDPKTQEKMIKTNLKKYGVEHYSSTTDCKLKVKTTSLQKFGSEYYSSTDECKVRVKSTSLCRFGTTYPMQNKEIKSKSRKTRVNISFQKLFSSNRLRDKCIPLFAINEYSGVYKNKYKFRCTKCNNEFEDSLDNGHVPRCPVCYPILRNDYAISMIENEIFEFCRSLVPNVEQSNRSILNSKEIDIYIPEKQLAIEFDGLYWHGELMGKNEKYHIDKTIQCIQNDIQLIHIFEDEWMDKQDIVKSVISSKLSKYENRYFARKCTIREIDNSNTKQFLFDNHLQGPINSKVNIGLFNDKDELVSLMTFSKPRYNKNYEWEIIRYCSKLNTQILGGMGKLFSYFKRTYIPKSIITYCDRRYGEGHSYEKIGFEFLKSSDPSYFYLANHQRESRIKYQKHKLSGLLETFDPNLTEWQNMQLNGYDRIWDCGHNVFGWYSDIKDK